MFLIRGDFWLRRITVGVIMLASLFVIRNTFGYSELLSSDWLIGVLALVCAFLSLSVGTLVLAVYTLLQLLVLSRDIAAVVLLFFLVSYFFCDAYYSKQKFHLCGITVLQRLGVAYVSPLLAGLFGEAGEATTIFCGTIISYYLKTVRDNAAMILDSAQTVSAFELLQQMLANQMFYVYLAAMLAMFVVVYVIRKRSVSYAWLLAVVFGVLVQFVILLGGYLFQGYYDRIGQLLVGDFITLSVGVVMYYLFQDLDYKRVERVQFEDDDYYYYVTAVPKIKLEKEEKEVKKITGSSEDGPVARIGRVRRRIKREERE